MDIDLEELKKMQADISEMKTALLGNPEFGVNGLAQLVKNNAEYIEKDKKFKAKAVGGLAVIQFLITVFVSYFKHD